jgi:sentrin-specific protease 7
MPKSTPTKSTQLAKRYIVIESNNQIDFEGLIKFLKGNETIGVLFTNDCNLLKHDNLDEAIVSLLNFKKPMKPICEEHETALVFPSSLLETELDSVASNLIEPNGKLGQNLASMFTNVAIEDKAPNGKQKNHIITILGKDYDRLSPGEFLNDTLIDFWISWLVYRMGGVSDQIHVFTTQFYTKLEQEGVESVMSWTAKKNIDIFEKKYIFVPVNKDIHWSLLVIVNPGNIVSDNDEEACNQNLEHPYILFMDSLRAHNKAKLQKTLYKWLNAEAARLLKFDRKDPYEDLTCPVEIASGKLFLIFENLFFHSFVS